MKWYNLSEEEKIKQVYAKFTIKDFWDFWSKGEDVYLEIRIMNFKVIKEVAKKLKLPFSISGIYVRSAIQLQNVVALTRDTETMWFGVNSRKKNYNKKGWKSFGGGDEFVESVNYLFIDIDRIVKERLANQKELEDADKLANKVLEVLGKQGWNKDYIKICSGNGAQLLIGLDIPIKMPEVEFVNRTKTYNHNSEFETTKHIFKNGIGKQLTNFSRKFKDELGVEVDASCFLIGKVAALHCTKNFKYDSFRWRGIIEIKNGINEGFTDYLLSSIDNVVEFKSKNPFSAKKLIRQNIIREGKLRYNALAKFLLQNEFPQGEINNTLWFQFKMLLRDSKFDVNSNEFKQYHNEIKNKHRRTFSLNIPDKKYVFNEMAVNNYCLTYGFAPIYKLWTGRNKKLDMGLEKLEWNDRLVSTNEYYLPGTNILKKIKKYKFELGEHTTLFDDLEMCKNKLEKGKYSYNKDIVVIFINDLIVKYGELKVKEWFDDGIFIKYLGYE